MRLVSTEWLGCDKVFDTLVYLTLHSSGFGLLIVDWRQFLKTTDFWRWNFLENGIQQPHFFKYPPCSGIASCVGTAGTYMTPTLEAALLCNSRAGPDLGWTSDWLRSFVNYLSKQNSLTAYSYSNTRLWE